MHRLNGKVALITGAAQGIGEAIARLFIEHKAIVIVSDINSEKGQALVQELGANAYFHTLDVALEAHWQTVAEYVQSEFGCLDILVNNAGITGLLETQGEHTPEGIQLEAWNKVHEVNLTGTLLGCKHAIPLMKASSNASIVNISSRSGLVGIPAATAYASSKAAVRNHTKSVALYCAEQSYPIRCNSIHPGAILTPMWDPMLGDGEARTAAIAAIAADVPLKTMGEPLDVAYGALYLASDEAKYVTGIELNIDGGILAGSAASPK